MEENAFVFFLVASPFYIFIGIMGGYFLIERWNNDNIFSQFLYGLIGTLYIGLIVAAVWIFYEEFFEWIEERKDRKKQKRLNS